MKKVKVQYSPYLFSFVRFKNGPNAKVESNISDKPLHVIAIVPCSYRKGMAYLLDIGSGYVMEEPVKDGDLAREIDAEMWEMVRI
jgi:hypothetical protein